MLRVRVALTQERARIKQWKELAQENKINISGICELIISHYVRTGSVFNIGAVYGKREYSESTKFIYLKLYNQSVINWIE